MKVVLTAAVLLLALASSAQAAQRYAAPEAKGPEPCVQAAPCSLELALTGAKENDEVIVGGGTYNIISPIIVFGKNLYLHGDFAGPMPKINASVLGLPINFIGAEEHVAYLEMNNTTGELAYGFVCMSGMKLERVRVLALSSTSAIGVLMGTNCLVRDSVIRAQGTNAIGLSQIAGAGPVSVARNLTAAASGSGSIGTVVSNEGSAADIRNSVFAGDAFDVRVTKNSRLFIGTSNFDSSNFDPAAQVIDLGGNQTAAPLFVDVAKGDYREAAGSPTIDAGVDDQLGALDFAGGARIFGPAPDIGAYEFVPPAPPPAAAAGQIQSLALAPSAFRAAKSGEATSSAAKKAKAPLGTSVSYSLSAAATPTFTVARNSSGRRVGKKCVKQTKANRSKPNARS